MASNWVIELQSRENAFGATWYVGEDTETPPPPSLEQRRVLPKITLKSTVFGQKIPGADDGSELGSWVFICFGNQKTFKWLSSLPTASGVGVSRFLPLSLKCGGKPAEELAEVQG